jgi:hypothetical protein
MMTLLFQIGQGIFAVIGLLCVLALGILFALGFWSSRGNEEEPDWDTANYDPESGNRRREFSEPRGYPADIVIDEYAFAPSPQQYSDLPAQWSKEEGIPVEVLERAFVGEWLPPLPERVYAPDSTPLPQLAAPAVTNGHSILESGFDMPEAAH